MEIIMLLIFIASVFTPFVSVILADGQIVGRTVKVVKANLNRDKQIVPGIVSADMVALAPRSKDWEAHKKLAELWQDAFDWFSIPDVVEVLRTAKLAEAGREEYVAPEKKALESVQYRKMTSGGYYGYYELERHAKRLFKAAVADSWRMFPMTPEQTKALALSQKYGWELIDNDLIRLARKKQMPTFDYIALTSV